ncbi:hypothetical protein SAMN05192575_103219 [Nocardioides alpinus]|uniref:Uncharacterized protein n=1 Tax=Nocardioides alpinus TaxID=748909 RepID=A0A1I0Y3K4_9ACTN|nr:hypothetical protein [Nocardioides alpinus]PKH42678.1 hypothetical protein CXG46_05265 [Nocardioides alpinus]SFB07754.1 hypothetical protein SAMN05192575_103219 [Nocardioides alpinus]
MSTPPDTRADLEDLLRSALEARAELVRPEDLSLLATAAPLRPRWQSPWVLLATAAVVLLILGVVFQGLAGQQRSDEIAPRPDQVELPPNVGRTWEVSEESSPARLDLDGDGVEERVEFLAEPTPDHDGRTRVQTTLSSTGEETYGLVELGSTIGVNALGPIDADADGDQELVLYTNALDGGPNAPFEPVVLDLREGLLVQAVSSSPELLSGGDVPVPGSETDHYDLFHAQSFLVEDGALVSTRSRSAFARSGMIQLAPETYVMDRYEWSMDSDGVLVAGEPGCRVHVPESSTACTADSRDDLPYVTSQSTDTIGVGEEVALEDGGLGYRVRVEAGEPPSAVVDGPGADGHVFGLDLPDPRVSTISPTELVSSDGASLFVTSASDPTLVQVVVETADQAGLVRLQPVGDIAFGTGTTDSGRAYRSWLTGAGVTVTVVEGADGSWEAWRWVRVGSAETFEMAALPWGTICFDDVEDPTTGQAC